MKCMIKGLKRTLSVCMIVIFNVFVLAGQQGKSGSIKGVVIEKVSGTPVEFANVVLKSKNDSSAVQGTTTDDKGEFVFEKLKYGEYKLTYSFIGYEKAETTPIVVDAKNSRVNLGKLFISEVSQNLGEVNVTATRSTFVNSIDRKTFNIGEDLMSKTGTVSELLQNVPSVQVDIDGNVSLRGSGNVTILINGKPSAMMNLNPAAVLQQMSANTIEKIEVITNPSAKYKPDGTAGIINIVTKKDKSQGLNGNFSSNYGNNGRYNGNVMINNNSGKLNVFGSYGIRKDDRRRIGETSTTQYSEGVELSQIQMYSEGHAKPMSNIATLGADYKLNGNNKVSLSGNYDYRFQRQDDITTYRIDSLQKRTEEYDRSRYLPELETDLELTSAFQHKFKKEGHELNFSYTSSFARENEDNYYTNTYSYPVSQFFYDNMFYHHRNNVSQLLVEYSNPLTRNSRLEIGYELDHARNDMDLHRDTTAMNQYLFIPDISRSNRFLRTENTHVLYVTYEREIGRFGFLGGLRGEQTFTEANLVTRQEIIRIPYTRIYPTLHLSYKLNDINELQLNYSHRINRPEDEQLNPFPEYQDLLNMRVGNPYLKPEDIHSLEFGYQLKKKSTTFISTIYYHYNYNGITSILTTKGDTIISTLQNLAVNKSAGLELILSTEVGRFANINLNSNIFYNTIDASELGFTQKKSDITFSLNASVSLNLTKSTIWQFTSNYTGERLTAQGKRLPSYVLNTGIRQDFLKRKLALTLTVSDVFNSLRFKNEIDTPDLQRYENRRRTSRIIYGGFTFNFGYSGKKQNGNSLRYDNQL